MQSSETATVNSHGMLEVRQLTSNTVETGSVIIENNLSLNVFSFTSTKFLLINTHNFVFVTTEVRNDYMYATAYNTTFQ